MRRHFADIGKATVVHLLLAADLIQRHNLDHLRIVKFGNLRIIKCDMTVLANAHANDIGRILFERLAVLLAGSIRVTVLAIQIMNALERNLGENRGLQKIAEALRRIGR